MEENLVQAELSTMDTTTEDKAMSTTSPKSTEEPAALPPKAQRTPRGMSLAYLLEKPDSKLGRIDLLPLFTDERARDSMNDSQLQSLCSLLPANAVLVDVDGRRAPDPDFLRYSMDFRNGLRCFVEDLQAGRFDPSWLKQAGAATEARARGEYDSFKAAEFEEFWGQRQAPPAIDPDPTATAAMDRMAEKGSLDKAAE
ncbi:MAG: hypothetical protein M1826_002696 [Phylliscum demangeonii]|nr:MAG: hypothetical protein M1826_002696 [Phylliscum demangeonii]